MDADGSEAIGSDELSSAFKVMNTLHTFSCDSTMIRDYFLPIIFPERSYMPAIYDIPFMNIHMQLHCAAAGNQGKEVNN